MSETTYLYAGQWEAYNRSISKMGFHEKLKYDYELKELIRKNKQRVLGFGHTLLTALLLFTYIFMILSVGLTGGFFPPFLLGTIITFGHLLLVNMTVIKRMYGKSASLGTLTLGAFALGALTALGAPLRDPSTIFFASFAVAGFGFVCMEIYRRTAKKNAEELIQVAEDELNVLAWDIRDDIYTGRVPSLKTKFKIPMKEENERIYLTEDAIVSDVLSKSYVTSGNKGLFGTSGFLSKLFSINYISKESVLADMRHMVNQNTQKKHTQVVQERQQAKYQALKNQVGKLVVTNKRVLFMGAKNGFQIRLCNIVNFGASQGIDNPTITVESSSGVRVLTAEGSVWIAMMIDKAKRSLETTGNCAETTVAKTV